MPQKTSGETVAAYASRNGLVAGDIYTFIILAEKKDFAYQSALWDDVLASQKYCSFGWVRLIVKENLASKTTTLNNMSDLFDLQTSGGDFAITSETLASFALGETILIDMMIEANNSQYTGTGAIGVIRSRLDQDLRSDSTLYVVYGNDAENMFGIASEYILDEWKNATTSVGDSDLILEGGDV